MHSECLCVDQHSVGSFTTAIFEPEEGRLELGEVAEVSGCEGPGAQA